MAESLSGYRTCTWCCLRQHDLCDGFARVHHVGSDDPEVVKCQCPGPEDTDTDPPLSWDPGEFGWAPTPPESALPLLTENSESAPGPVSFCCTNSENCLLAEVERLAEEVEELRDQLAAAVDVISALEDDPASSLGVNMITEERQRQILDEGYDGEHDARHTPAHLIDAAMSYIYAALDQRDSARMHWPWRIEYFKPKDQVSNLTRAGALIAAAIDRATWNGTK